MIFASFMSIPILTDSAVYLNGVPVKTREDGSQIPAVVEEFGPSFSFRSINFYVGRILALGLRTETLKSHLHDIFSIWGVLMCEEVLPRAQ